MGVFALLINLHVFLPWRLMQDILQGFRHVLQEMLAVAAAGGEWGPVVQGREVGKLVRGSQ